ncbi:MAG: CoA pyrophosphatase [Flavobacteriaceae bacterium]|nr:CoA pyrophosphatase [Flavobacteriaceae bacterium]
MKSSIHITFDDLREKLDFTQIPGWIAQKTMAPPDRQKMIDQGRFNAKKPKIAAVLILIYEENGLLKFPVIHRNTYPGVHSNQIGFPGGKIEKGDKDMADTAKRESLEEINAQPDKIEILGELSELFIPPSNFLVFPYVGIYHHPPDFSPCDYEVKEIIPITLNEVLLDSKRTLLVLEHQNKPYQVPAFELNNGMKIWGATAMMLNEFYTFLQNSLHLPTENS